MSERSVSASWGLQSDQTPTLSPVQSHQPNPSARNSFFYTNTHANMNTNGDYTTQQSQQQTLARPHAPPSANSLAWLRPWRTTQDCRQGGLALLYSMQEILTNVERARQSSMEAVYAPVRTSSPASAAVSAAQFGTAEDSANTSLTRRLSMRLNASTSQPRSREADGDDIGAGRCSNASRSVSREREAATPTLLDYMLPGSSSGNTRHVPPMWLDSDAPPLPGSSVSQSSAGGGVDGDRPKILTRASRGLEEQHSLSLGGADAQRSGAASLSHTPKAAFAIANVLPEKQEEKEAARGSSSSGAAAAAITDTSRSSQPLPPAASPKQQETHRSERQTAPTDSPVVPAIPRFDDLKAEQEALQRQMQALQGPHPRSEAAQKKQRALLHSSADNSDTEGQSSGSGGSPGGPQQATARRGGPPDVGTARPMQPHLATSPDRKAQRQTALRPGSEGGERYLSLSDSSSGGSGGGGGGVVDDGPVDDAGDGTDSERVVMFYDEEDMDGEDKADDEEVEVSDRMSETNFGEGGHLACVPGDTLHSRYTLLKALGVGRSSRVWLAADLEQCSLARRHLIRQLGEREARRLFRPQERPMFVAIKVFRCSAMYADCAEYEEKLSTYVTGCVKLRQLRLPRPVQSSPTPPRCRSRANSLSSTSPAAASPASAPTSPSGQSSVSNGSLTMPSALSTASRRSSTSPRPLSAAAQASQRLTTFRDAFTVSGQYGVHQCLVMDVLGAGVDKAINETHLAGFPAEVARSILLSTLQGLSVLATCHIIHTDLKPENLLFTDLEADIAAEMRRFQSLQLQTRSRSGLWSSFTHSRENVLAYAQRREEEEEERRAEQQDEGEEVAAAQRTWSLNNSASGGSSCERTRVHSPRSLSNSESVSLLAQTHVPHLVRGDTDDGERSGPGVLSDQRKAVSGSGGSSSSFHHHETNSNSYNRCGDDKPFTSAPRSLRAARPRRPAYQVRVTDFGLSFITPPCLRAGLRAMACYAADIGITEDEFLRDDPLSQLQWLYGHQQEQQQQQELTGAARLTGWADVDGVELRALQQEAAREDDERLRRTCDMDDRSAGDRSPSGVTHDASSAADPFTSVLSAGSGAAAAAPPPSRTPNDFSVVTQQQTGVSVRHVDTESASALCSLHHGSSDSLDAGKGVTPTRASTDAFGRLLKAPPAALRTASYHSPVSHTLTAAPSSAMMPPSAPESPHMTATEKSIFPQRCPPLKLQKPQLSDTQERGEREKGKDEGGAQRRPEQEKEERGPTGPAYHGTMPPLTLTRFVDPRPPTTLDTSMTSNDAGICKGDGGDAQQHISPTNRSAAVHARATALLSPRSPQRRATTTAAASSSSSPSATAFSSLTALRRLELAIVRSQRYTRGATVQSREYRSPEVLLGNFFLPSCDVWSLGCIAYELITGRFLMDCIGDREHFGRQLARQLRRDQKQRQAQQQQQRGFREVADPRYGSALDEESGESESEVEWDGQPIYVDDHEQDLDVFHLKSMIRLLGPPPLSYLNQRPIGLFVTDYFDHNGNFRFWEDGEAAEAGVGLADVYRRPEQRYWSRQQRQGEDGAGAATGQSAALRPLTSLVSAVEAESMDDFECHIRDYTSNGEDDDDDDNDDAYDRGSLRSRPFSSMQRVDAATTGNVASHLFSSSSVAGPVDLGNSPSDATPSMLSMTPHSLTGPSAATSYGRHPSVAAAASGARAASLLDTRNYPIETPDWLEVRQILREKLATEEEALGFEGFLLKCLQWDPAQRATAAELLGDPWMVKYSPHIAEAVDSDGDDEESEAEEEEEEGRS